MEKLQIPYPVVVEGKYDRLALLSVMDGTILTTEGFGIFKKSEKAALLMALAKKTPLIVLTDPDGAGALIRSHIAGIVPKDRVIPLYVPRVAGKEKRKSEKSAEGVLGVEGQEKEELRRVLSPFAADRPAPARADLTKLDFYKDGLTGRENCSERRNALAALFGLPPDMTPNALLAALSVIATREEYAAAVEKI